jgi:hypothetical protein
MKIGSACWELMLPWFSFAMCTNSKPEDKPRLERDSSYVKAGEVEQTFIPISVTRPCITELADPHEPPIPGPSGKPERWFELFSAMSV